LVLQWKGAVEKAQRTPIALRLQLRSGLSAHRAQGDACASSNPAGYLFRMAVNAA
jgi:hypothetical protein